MRGYEFLQFEFLKRKNPKLPMLIKPFQRDNAMELKTKFVQKGRTSLKLKTFALCLLLAMTHVIFFLPAPALAKESNWNVGVGTIPFGPWSANFRWKEIVYQCEYMPKFSSDPEKNNRFDFDSLLGCSVLRRIAGNWLTIGGGAYYATSNDTIGVVLAPQLGMSLGKIFVLNFKIGIGPYFYHQEKIHQTSTYNPINGRSETATVLEYEKNGVGYMVPFMVTMGIEI
jgi:hypothetical protein